ncbi:MAG: hypothetical protein ACOCW1_04980 [Chitinispirillaceae bacterium]
MKKFLIFALLPMCVWAQVAQKPSQQVLLGACPTMIRHYLPDTAGNVGYEVIAFNNTMEVMAALQAGKIDIAYVGRPARESEGAGELKAFPLRTGWTLVGSSFRMIDESALERATVHTVADSLTIRHYLPSGVTIRRHDSVSAALDSCGQDEAVFLSWDDYRETYPLVIVRNSDGKLPRFRNPTLYCRKNQGGKLKSIAELIGGYVNKKGKADR